MCGSLGIGYFEVTFHITFNKHAILTELEEPIEWEDHMDWDDDDAAAGDSDGQIDADDGYP